MAIQKAMNKVRKSITSCQINDALNIYNKSSTKLEHNLLINSPILVYRKGNAGQSEEWKRLYNLSHIQYKLVIIELPHNPINSEAYQ